MAVEWGSETDINYPPPDWAPRSCCDSTEAQWHSRPCTVNGPIGPGLVGEYTFQGTDVGADGEGRVKMGVGGELHSTNVRGVWARNGWLTPYRQCCATLPGSVHWQGCSINFFAEGQTVIKPDINTLNPWAPARLRIQEDVGSSDRTFENETRPL